jgi:hypothetical protein
MTPPYPLPLWGRVREGAVGCNMATVAAASPALPQRGRETDEPALPQRGREQDGLRAAVEKLS